MKRRLVSVLLCAVLVLGMAGCGNSSGDKKNATDSKGEVSADSEEEAWKKEEAYGKTLKYFVGEGCTSATSVADELGYYEDEGLKVEGFKSESDIEALGTGQVDIVIAHIAKAVVPITNGVDITFTGGAHLLKGCKAIYVPADSEIQNYEDLKGKKISVPNGIGGSDYNITARLLLESGMNPLKDVTLTQVDKDACVTAMQNGEIDAALLSESFGYKLVNEGILKKIDSKNGDSQNELCCVIMMNGTFVKNNPITAKKMTSAVKKALKWMGENPEDSTDLLMKLGLEDSDRDANLTLNKEMEFGLLNFDDDYITEQMRGIVDDYIEVGLITSMDDTDKVMDLLWNPLGSAE